MLFSKIHQIVFDLPAKVFCSRLSISSLGLNIFNGGLNFGDIISEVLLLDFIHTLVNSLAVHKVLEICLNRFYFAFELGD